MKYLKHVLILFLLSSCGDYYLTKNKFRDIIVNKKRVTTASKAIITTTVDKYSTSRKWYYGSIKIFNFSPDTIKFNFHQKIKAEDILLEANYNIYPVSWSYEMFLVSPNCSRTWNVVWKNEKPIQNYLGIVLIADTQIVSFHHY